MTTAPIEELAPRTEDEVREHLGAGRLVEGLQHMSPEYLKGIRRVLTVSADRELISPPPPSSPAPPPTCGPPSTPRRSTTTARPSRSSRTSWPTPTSATGCSPT